MNSVLIITGGNINIEFARKYVEGNEFSHVIAVDGGLLAAENMGIIPDLIVGDFEVQAGERFLRYLHCCKKSNRTGLLFYKNSRRNRYKT